MDAYVRSRWFHCLFGLILLLIGLPSGCSQDVRPADFTGRTPIVRVLLLQNRSVVLLTATAPPTAQLGPQDRPRSFDLAPGTTAPLTLTAQGWRLGAAPVGKGDLTLLPASEGSVTVDGHAYRGHFRFVPRLAAPAPGLPLTFDVVNDLDVESYLKGVIAREMLPDFAIEAYKAQAVVARTYAIYEAKAASRGTTFDLFCDQRSQVYGGISSETCKSRQAVEQTAGQVVAAGQPGRERIFKAYFSACCGGAGQSAADAFGDAPSAPLVAGGCGTLCSMSPSYNWGPIVVGKAELTRRFRQFATLRRRPEADMAAVTRVDVLTSNDVGRPVRFTVTDARGKTYNWSGEELRVAVNTGATPKTRLLSSLFQIVNTPGEVRFVNGHGAGHGVGMCQWCAQRRAQLGMTYDAIVTTAYPQSILLRAY